eukprot:SAG22_NODE_7665_length_719_cov_0.669355_2_plen_206_part_01
MASPPAGAAAAAASVAGSAAKRPREEDDSDAYGGDDGDYEDRDSDEESDGGGGVASAADSNCVLAEAIEHLDQLTELVPAFEKHAQFKRQALVRGITALKKLQRAGGTLPQGERFDQLCVPGAVLEDLKGKTLDKVTEFVVSGTTRRFAAASSNPRVVTETLLRRVWGIGAHNATVLYEAGYRTIAELQAAVRGDASIPPSCRAVL